MLPPFPQTRDHGPHRGSRPWATARRSFDFAWTRQIRPTDARIKTKHWQRHSVFDCLRPVVKQAIHPPIRSDLQDRSPGRIQAASKWPSQTDDAHSLRGWSTPFLFEVLDWSSSIATPSLQTWKSQVGKLER
jgi:hypothetical protein